MTKFKEKLKKASIMVSVLTTSVMNEVVCAMAGGFSSNPSSVTLSNDIDIVKVLSGMIGWILNIFMGVGIVMAILGAVQFFQALKDDQPEGQSRAIKLFLAGAGLASIRVIIKGVGLISA